MAPAQLSRKRPRGDRGGNDGPPPGAISLEDFNSIGQNDPALHRYRRKREFVQRARVVRDYKRLRKRDGLDAGVEPAERRGRQFHTHKPDPLKKSREAAKLLLTTRAAEREKSDTARNDKDRRAKKRKQLSRKLGQRTKRGQPVMRNEIDNILKKLQRDLKS